VLKEEVLVSSIYKLTKHWRNFLVQHIPPQGPNSGIWGLML